VILAIFTSENLNDVRRQVYTGAREPKQGKTQANSFNYVKIGYSKWLAVPFARNIAWIWIGCVRFAVTTLTRENKVIKLYKFTAKEASAINCRALQFPC
jgi:hypothetical protein